MFGALHDVVHLILRKTILFLVAGFLCLGTFSMPAYEAPKNPNVNTGDYFRPDYGHPLISSHRSGKGAAPENTLKAVKSNLIYAASDAAIIEMDVQLTKDGEIVLYHSLFLDENSDSAEHFGRKNTAVFMKTYRELRELNLGENYKREGKYPYRGLRGNDIPDDIRITRLAEVFRCVETRAPGKFRYIIEVKYPHPWAPKIVDGIYRMMTEYDMADRVIIGSFWPDVTRYIDRHYSGKINRSANPFEIVDLYGCYTRNDDLRREKFNYMALQLPFYWDDGKLLVGNLGKAGFIDYAHKYGLSVQYWTVDRTDDAKYLTAAGADLLMTNHPERLRKALHTEHTYDEGKLVKAASCIAAGETVFTCTVCGSSYTQAIPKTAHTFRTVRTPATLEKNGKVEKVCTVCGKAKRVSTVFRPKTFTLSAMELSYDGKVKTPTVTVTDAAGEVIGAGSYRVKYFNHTQVGTAKVRVIFRGDYSGTRELEFRILPPKTAIRRLTGGAGCFKAEWKALRSGGGYQLQYAEDESFQNAKTVTIKDETVTARQITNLAGGRVYYVRIRTLQAADGRYYASFWSAAQPVKTR